MEWSRLRKGAKLAKRDLCGLEKIPSTFIQSRGGRRQEREGETRADDNARTHYNKSPENVRTEGETRGQRAELPTLYIFRISTSNTRLHYSSLSFLLLYLHLPHPTQRAIAWATFFGRTPADDATKEAFTIPRATAPRFPSPLSPSPAGVEQEA